MEVVESVRRFKEKGTITDETLHGTGINGTKIDQSGISIGSMALVGICAAAAVVCTVVFIAAPKKKH